MSITEKKLLTNNEVIKLISFVIVIASAWYRLEFKFDEAQKEIIKKIDEHIIRDGYEKDNMRSEIYELRKRISQIEDEAKEYLKTEFVKPEEPRIKTNRQ